MVVGGPLVDGSDRAGHLADSGGQRGNISDDKDLIAKIENIMTNSNKGSAPIS
jgi:hypothetical protein